MTNFLLNRMPDPPARQASMVRCRCFAKAFCERAPLGEMTNERMSGLDALLTRFLRKILLGITESQSNSARPLFEVPPIADQAISQDLRVHTEYLHTPSGCETIRRASRICSGAHFKRHPIHFPDSHLPSTVATTEANASSRKEAAHYTQCSD